MARSHAQELVFKYAENLENLGEQDANWVRGAARTIEQQLSSWCAVDLDAELGVAVVHVAYESPLLGMGASQQRVRALQAAMHERGWHLAEVEDPKAGYIAIGVMLNPVEVRLLGGESFEAVFDRGHPSGEELAEHIATNGAWRGQGTDWEFVPAHQIESVVVTSGYSLPE